MRIKLPQSAQVTSHHQYESCRRAIESPHQSEVVMNWLTLGLGAASVLACNELRKAVTRTRELETEAQIAGRELRRATVQQISFTRKVLKQQRAAARQAVGPSQDSGYRLVERQLASKLDQLTSGAEQTWVGRVPQLKVFVSDAGRPGYAVYSFDLPTSPYVFLQSSSAAEWQLLRRDATWLEARAIILGLSDLLSSSTARRALKGSQVMWLTDNQAVASSLSQFPRQITKNTGLMQEYKKIDQLVSQLQVRVLWRWRSRKHAAIEVAHQLSALSGTETANSRKVKTMVEKGKGPALRDLRLAVL